MPLVRYERPHNVTDTSTSNGKQTLGNVRALQLPLRRHLERKQQRKLLREVVAAISGSGSGHVTAAMLGEKSGGKEAETV